MKEEGKYKITIFGEFKDKALELNFINYEMNRYAKNIRHIIQVFGLIFMLFIISDYLEITNTKDLFSIFVIRSLFLLISIIISLTVIRINFKYITFIVLLYELVAITAFIIIINQYESITVLSYFSVIVITLAIYIIPNKIIYSILVTVLLNIIFFIFSHRHILGLNQFILYKLIAYEVITFIFCYSGTYLTNYYKRKQFADSLELERLSSIDFLTGIYNRAKFNEKLNQWIDYCNRYNAPLSLVIFDIDNFKMINDNCGHQIGDCVLKDLTVTIKKIIRITDIFARWGGEEFVLLLPNTNKEQALELTERIRKSIQKSKFTNANSITCSFGLATLTEKENAESFLKRADKLLYSAKNRGKNIIISENEFCINYNNNEATSLQ